MLQRITILLFVLSVAAGSATAQDGNSAGTGNIRLPAGDYTLAIVVLPGSSGQSAIVARTALRRIAQIQGLPYSIVDSTQELSRYSVAVLAAGPSNAELTPAWRECLYSFVEDGGTLLIPGPVGSEVFSLLGLRGIDSVRTRMRMSFTGKDLILSYVDHPREKTISLGNGGEEVYSRVIWSHGVSVSPFARVLARFDDDSAALVRNYYGRGAVYYLGLSFAESVLLPQTGGDYEAQRDFVNAVEPSADVIMLLIKALYEEHAPRALYMSPIPQGRPTALLLSHDVDAQTSFEDSLKFARLAEQYSARATFFINTKYFKDWKDIDYYNLPENKEVLRSLQQREHELGSHTVSHDRNFNQAPPGSAAVDYSTYKQSNQITIQGEVRVSKELLERDVPGHATRSFRAGYLSFPEELISVLEAAGYRYDSSFSANDVLTTFPYYAFREQHPGSQESQVIEIPVTLDDALEFLTEKNIEEAVSKWKDIMDAHTANESITVLLIHPSDSRIKDYKLRAERELLEHARKSGAWIGGIEEFGRFWRARHELGVAGMTVEQGVLTVHLDQPVEAVHPWIALVIPSVAEELSLRVMDARGRVLGHEKLLRNGKYYIRLLPRQ